MKQDIDKEKYLSKFRAFEKKQEPEPEEVKKPEEVNPVEKNIYELHPELEKRTKTFLLTMRPSLYNQVKAKAKAENTSMNNYIHSLLEENLKK